MVDVLRLAPRAEAALARAGEAGAAGAGAAGAGAAGAGAAGAGAAGLLRAVLADRDAVAARAVARLGLDARALVAAAGSVPGRDGREADRSRWVHRDRWLHRAEDEARRRGHGYIGTEHLLLGLLDDEPVAGALAALGSSARAVRGQVHRTLLDAGPGGEWRADGPGRPLDELVPAVQPALAEVAAVCAVADEEPVTGLSWAEADCGACFGEGRAVRTAVYGWADPARGVPVTADTRFRAGSVTKIATALLVLRLRDRGLVDLDEPAAGKLRSVRLLNRDGATSPATVRQLLTHTAGLPRGSGLRHYAGPVPAASESFAAGIRADLPAGQWSYSNLGFVALGALAADLLGAPFGECLRDVVLGPLGLIESASLPEVPAVGSPSWPPGGPPSPGGLPPLPSDGAAMDIPLARGHTFDAGLVFPVQPSAMLALGAGDLVASARDMAVLAAASVDGPLLSAESAREMLAPAVRCGPDTWQGLGVQVEYHGSVRLAGHGGSFPGFDAAAYVCPETGQSIALLANTNTGLLKGQIRTSLMPRHPA
jgi:CubicO group peptidase (beta-lactamase class C family)